MNRSLLAVLVGTFVLRFCTGLTGALVIYYVSEIPKMGGPEISSVQVGLFTAAFFASELVLSTPFGMLSDRIGHHRVMQIGPIFGAVAVLITWRTVDPLLLGGTRLLQGASTAASVPSILGFIAAITAGNELLRGQAAARFEAATLAGLGAGLVGAGFLWDRLHENAFLVNAALYAISFAVYRFGVSEAPDEEEERVAPHYGWQRYRSIVTASHVWLLAPTWIAINAALGLWTSQSLFQVVKEPPPKFSDQLLMGGFDPVQVSIAIAAGLIVFFAGLVYWGNKFNRFRRTTIIFFGIFGGALVVAAAVVINHSAGFPGPIRLLFALGVVAGLFVLAGATPAALGLLADMSERFPADRGAIMGLYSVFLGIGQIVGSLIGGIAAEVRGIDGILVATLALLGVALVPLFRLRDFEHLLAPEGPAKAPTRLAEPEL